MMPYQVVGKGPYQVQTLQNKKWYNVKDMAYDTLAEAWQKVVELIEKDMNQRIPADVQKELAKAVQKMKAEGGKVENKGNR